MRMFATAGGFQVLKSGAPKQRFFSNIKEKSLSVQKAREIFFTATEKIKVFDNLDTAKNYAIYTSAHPTELVDQKMNPEYYHIDTVPVYEVDLRDDFTEEGAKHLKIKWPDSNTKASWQLSYAAQEHHILPGIQDVVYYELDEREMVDVVAVHVFHPAFKKAFIEINNDKPQTKKLFHLF